MATTLPTPRLHRYAPQAGACDEAYDEHGRPRGQNALIFDRLASTDLVELAKRSRAYLATESVAFRTVSGLKPFVVDPVPRVVSAADWQMLDAGLRQRGRALNQFLLDVYDRQQLVGDGVIPARVIETAEFFEPDLVGFRPPGGVYIHMSGTDMVRGSDGVLCVLEDNVRSPSGVSFAAVARRMSDAVLDFAADVPKRDPSHDLDTLGDLLHASAPDGTGDPRVVLLSDGPSSPAWFEHREIAGTLGVTLATLHQLEQRRGLIGTRIGNDFRPVDVIYRRTNLERLRTREGRLTGFGELLLEPIKKHRLSVVNSFGTGVADDKLTHAYVDDLIRYYLGEQPLIPSVKTYDPALPGALTEIKANLTELVLKPRGGLGGSGVMIGSMTGPRELGTMRSRIASKPQRFVAQEIVQLSTHPTAVRGQLQPRHVDLRPYTVMRPTGAEPELTVLNSSLTRVALTPGSMIVNSSSNGGSKDTWIPLPS